MRVNLAVRQLPLEHLAEACRRETERFLRNAGFDDAFCFELFRRAVVERGEPAWEKIVTQYRRMVLAWVRRHPDLPSLGADEDGDHWVDAVFVRFWSAVKPERFAQFEDTRRILAYLKMCAHSVLQDELRQRAGQLATVPLEPLVGLDESSPAPTSAAIAVEARSDGRLLAQELFALVQSALHDDREREVFQLVIVQGYTPREICQRHPDRFPNADIVYQTKRNLLDRLRRHPEIRAYLG
ncbi:MAG TPA: sigma-70 family RNA polymerase sigma factor [Chloroflexota bacterium]|nr:sigma-70 family RNA polymerase sigma factor [Chloroflexota bacterium]